MITVIALTAGIAACGSSSDGSGASTAKSSASPVADAGGPAAAAKVIAPYTGKPSPFPVVDKLSKVPEGATIAYMDSGTPISSLLAELATGATKAMGVKLARIKTGTAANTTTAAFDTVVSQKPDAVLNNGIAPELWVKQLKQLQAAKIPITASAIATGEQYGLKPIQAGPADNELSGKLMANYVIAKLDPKADVALYDVPEVPLTGQIAQQFTIELKRICPRCKVRTTHVPAATLGNKAPSTVVSDLQSHPDTTVAVFATDEVELGLPQALGAAGIEVKTLGFGPGPTNLQYLKEGKETAALAYDLPVLAWTQVDQTARAITGQPLKGQESKGLGVVQFLTQQDITFDPNRGWTGYPDFAERFAKLWGSGR